MTAKAEATSAPIEFEFEGENYSIPPASEWDLDALEAWEEGKVATLVRALLGPEQYATFRSVPRTVGDLSRFAETLQDAVGAGN